MRTPLLLACFAFFVCSSASRAQLLGGLTAGMRVRATVRAAEGTTTHTGTILQIRSDSLVVRTGTTTDIAIFSARDVTALDVSTGRPVSAWSAIKWSGIAGAIVGGVVGLKRYDENGCIPPTTACRNEAMVIGAAAGAAVGGVIGGLGSIAKGEQWEPMRIRP